MLYFIDAYLLNPTQPANHVDGQAALPSPLIRGAVVTEFSRL